MLWVLQKSSKLWAWEAAPDDTISPHGQVAKIDRLMMPTNLNFGFEHHKYTPTFH